MVIRFWDLSSKPITLHEGFGIHQTARVTILFSIPDIFDSSLHTIVRVQLRRRTVRRREDAALVKAQASELARCVAEGAAQARVETQVARLVLERDRASADAQSLLRAEVAEARAAQHRATGLAAAAEEHEQEASAGERLRLRAETATARKAETVARRDLDEHRREAAAAAAAASEQLENVSRKLSATEYALEARATAAEDEARIARGALAAARDVSLLEEGAAAVAAQRHRREAAEDDTRVRRQLAVALADLEAGLADTITRCCVGGRIEILSDNRVVFLRGDRSTGVVIRVIVM